MTWYWVILSSFCSIGVSLPHTNAPLATKNQCLIVKNRWGCRRIFERDVKTHKHEVKFSPLAHATSSSYNGELLKVGPVLRAEEQMAQLRGLQAPGVVVAQSLCEAWSLTMLSPLRQIFSSITKNLFLEVVVKMLNKLLGVEQTEGSEATKLQGSVLPWPSLR